MIGLKVDTPQIYDEARMMWLKVNTSHIPIMWLKQVDGGFVREYVGEYGGESIMDLTGKTSNTLEHWIYFIFGEITISEI